MDLMAGVPETGNKVEARNKKAGNSGAVFQNTQQTRKAQHSGECRASKKPFC
jgi:hypothetical protein